MADQAEFKPQVLRIIGTPVKYEANTQEELKVACTSILTWLLNGNQLNTKSDKQTDIWNPMAGFSQKEIVQQILETENEVHKLVRSYHFLMTNLQKVVQIEIL
ncbi:MAG: hypothetical protein QM489_00405 [Candidatus Izemoplasma sp.]